MKKWFADRAHLRDFLIIILAASFAFSMWLFVRQFTQTVRSRSLHPLRHAMILDTNSIDSFVIEPWMTFRYINTVFRLPPSYLLDKLSITDAAYPHESVSAYAHAKALDQAAVIKAIKSALLDFYNTK